MKTVDVSLYSKFIITGLLYNSTKRFRKEFTGDLDGYTNANMTNIWNGTLWGVKKDNGKKEILKRVYN